MWNNTQLWYQFFLKPHPTEFADFIQRINYFSQATKEKDTFRKAPSEQNESHKTNYFRSSISITGVVFRAFFGGIWAKFLNFLRIDVVEQAIFGLVFGFIIKIFFVCAGIIVLVVLLEMVVCWVQICYSQAAPTRIRGNYRSDDN